MKKIKLIALLCICSTFSQAQTYSGDRIIARNGLYLKNYWFSGVASDTADFITPNYIPTAEAVKLYVDSRAGAGTESIYSSNGKLTGAAERRFNLDGYGLRFDSGYVKIYDSLMSSTGKLYGGFYKFSKSENDQITYDSLMAAGLYANGRSVKLYANDLNNLDTMSSVIVGRNIELKTHQHDSIKINGLSFSTWGLGNNQYITGTAGQYIQFDGSGEIHFVPFEGGSMEFAGTGFMSGAGFNGYQNFSQYYGPNSFIQKVYVDSVDAFAVRKTGNETITGVKTFSNQPVFSDGLTSNQWSKFTAPVSTAKMTLGSLSGVGMSVGGSSGVTYGLNVGVNVSNGLTWLQSARWTGSATAYHMTLQASGGNVGIGDVTPTEKLHLDGNFRLSGALMPGNSAGTAGQVLTSAGAGSAPTWESPTALRWPLELNGAGDSMRINTATGTVTAVGNTATWDYSQHTNITLIVSDNTGLDVINSRDGDVGRVLVTNGTGSYEFSVSGNSVDVPAMIENGDMWLLTFINIKGTLFWEFSNRLP